jgi:protein SCO1/2
MKKILSIAFLLSSLFVHAQMAVPKYGILEKLDSQVNTNVFLRSSLTDSVMLSALIDKPTLLHFSYFDCYEMCFKMYRGLSEIIKYSDYVLGIDYNLITISLNPYEDFSKAEMMKTQLIDSFNIPIATQNWQFFTMNETALKQLSEESGYYFSVKGGQSINPLVTVLLTPESMVSHYFYGYYYMPWHFQQAIDAAKEGESSTSRLTSIKYYYNYIPSENANFRALIVFSGLTIVSLVVILFFYLVIINKRKKLSAS